MSIIRKIYFIADEQGRIKIGQSSQPLSRLNALQAATADTLTLIAIESDHTGYRELELHCRFRHLKIRGEWFWLCDDLLDYLINHSHNASTPESLQKLANQSPIDSHLKAAYQKIAGAENKACHITKIAEEQARIEADAIINSAREEVFKDRASFLDSEYTEIAKQACSIDMELCGTREKRRNIILLPQDEEAIRIINEYAGGAGKSSAIRYALRSAARIIKTNETS